MTIKDIAQLSGYAISTVSRVLNNHADVSEQARTRVMEIVQEHNFELNTNAKQLKQQTSSIIAVIVKGTMNMLFSSILETMQEEIKFYGYTAAIYYVDEDDDEVAYACRLCRELKPIGLAFLGGAHQSFLSGFSKISLPSILVTTSLGELSFQNLSSIGTDDVAAASFALEKLIASGHREIGFLGGRREASYPTHQRLLGCERTLRAHGFPFSMDHQYEECRFSYQSGYDSMCRLIEKSPLLTAVFCMSDVIAMGAIRALSDTGRCVPQSISVVGFDGIVAGAFYLPRLATIQQDSYNIARRSVEILQNTIEYNAPAQHEIMPFKWEVGESIRPLTEPLNE